MYRFFTPGDLDKLFQFMNPGGCGNRTRKILLPVIGLLLGLSWVRPTTFLYAADGHAKPIDNRTAGVSAAITDCGAVMNGERRRSGLSVRPFCEDWTGFVTIENNGTSFIDHFRITFSCPMKDSEAIHIDLISPPMPSFLWKPFAGDMLRLCTRGMTFTIKDGTVNIHDVATGRPIAVTGIYPSKPLEPSGLPPGASILIEFTEPYSQCVEGFAHSIAERENLDMEIQSVDPEKNIMHMIVRNFKVLFFTFDEMTIGITFKGQGRYGSCSLDLSIDDDFYDDIPWVDYEWK
jgi:hypothetical protein